MGRLQALLAGRSFTDLTHAFHPGQPHFPAFPDEIREAVFDLEKATVSPLTAIRSSANGVRTLTLPSHFIRGGRTLNQIPVEDMVLPLAILDITARVTANADATPTMEDVQAWERRNGAIAPGAFVALRTGWSHRWPDADAMANRDDKGASHTPGWSQEVLSFLIEERSVTAVGHEQTDTDPGLATSRQDFSLETYVLARNRWQIELMANLDGLPEAGAILIASWPKPLHGSGFPARVFAIH